LHHSQLPIGDQILKYSQSENRGSENSHCYRGPRGTPPGAILGLAILVGAFIIFRFAYYFIDKPNNERQPLYALAFGTIGFAVIAQAVVLFLKSGIIALFWSYVADSPW
jgi:hypothetical protein